MNTILPLNLKKKITKWTGDFIILETKIALKKKLPLQYTCSESPKLLATAAEQFKYGMPYAEYFGGVVAISWDHLKLVNGLSNR